MTTLTRVQLLGLVAELKVVVEQAANERGPCQWHRAHDKRHELYEQVELVRAERETTAV